MNCRVCHNLLFPGREVLQCYCRAYTHAYCWGRHILEHHRPPVVVGTITVDGEFRPKEPETKQGHADAVSAL